MKAPGTGAFSNNQRVQGPLSHPLNVQNALEILYKHSFQRSADLHTPLLVFTNKNLFKSNHLFLELQVWTKLETQAPNMLPLPFIYGGFFCEMIVPIPQKNHEKDIILVWLNNKSFR